MDTTKRPRLVKIRPFVTEYYSDIGTPYLCIFTGITFE